ncbi:MAG: FtsW/RodA/SpoVE family cell cycle protein, partial [bacterium]|nr:FtsW/RodA/SpoVE family cell cycle protein [bacterium]
QAVMNVAVVTGMMPTTGLPLPFFSSGGTSIAVLMCAVGLLLNVSRGERWGGRLSEKGASPDPTRKAL